MKKFLTSMVLCATLYVLSGCSTLDKRAGLPDGWLYTKKVKEHEVEYTNVIIHMNNWTDYIYATFTEYSDAVEFCKYHNTRRGWTHVAK